ncbi:Wzz/FepE/Etk N-terminal domain-containing protein [Pseudomonas guariconensis]|uniref:LPS O-antigen chain length determinant protein WzzB n=1 Tax=Pseudomonas guariconensis TaxID=1288410 RepID=UPI003EE07C39
MRSERERLSSRDGDEIDLFELIEGVWSKRKLITVAVIIMTGFALAYSFWAAPIFEAKVIVQPPSQNDIAQLNYGRGGASGLEPFKVKDVSEVYLRTLQSESLRREFFRKFYVPSLSEKHRKGSQDELYYEFSKVLTLGVAGKDNSDRYYVKARLEDPDQAAQWVSYYIEMAGGKAKAEIIKDARADAMVKADNLQQLINASRESARKQREDQISKLSEALMVARSIGLVKPPIITNGLSKELSAGMEGALTYMRGSKALEAEINNLRNRPSDDPFIENLREKQEELNFYRSLRIDPAVVQVYRQDGALESPDRPVSLSKYLIVLLGVISGIIVGVACALVLYLSQVRSSLSFKS